MCGPLLGESRNRVVRYVRPNPDAPLAAEAAATATWSLSASLEHLEPVLRTLKEKLAASAPEHFTVEFGVKLGGESGIILAKGTAEVNLKITMIWDRKDQGPGVIG
jgi:Trypsin-co-occurring domain 1